ncbi:hypothetical protein CCP2SC5_10061 [Azospirillaceae bacterium]
MTPIFIDPALDEHGILVAATRMIGFPISPSVDAAVLCIVPHSLPGKLCCCPGEGFYIEGCVAFYDKRRMSAVMLYNRRARYVTAGTRAFVLLTDDHGKNDTLRDFTITLFRLLLENKKAVEFLWWFPDGAVGAVNYRVDVDDNIRNSIDPILDRLKAALPWSSLYFTTAHFIKYSPPLQRASQGGAEIGSHFHHHYTFHRDWRTNARNLAMSLKFFREKSLPITGVATPSAKSFPGIARLLAQHKLTYTSNFGVLYDMLPIEFTENGQRYLEVPIHPTAPGNILKSASQGEDLDDFIFAYYCDVAQRLSAASLPIFFYGHNNDTVDISLLPRLTNWLKSQFPDHAFLRLDQYAAFWTQRLNQISDWKPQDSTSPPPDNRAKILPDAQDQIEIHIKNNIIRRPFSLNELLRSPLKFSGYFKKPRHADRLFDRYELETVLPLNALAYSSLEGWKSAGFKIAYRVIKILTG